MYKIICFLLLFLITLTSFSQKQKNNFVDHVGFGYSNLGGLGFSKLLSDTNYTPQFYLEYHEGVDTSTFLRFGISANFNAERIGTIKYYSMIPFNIFAGIEKRLGNEKVNFVYGADLFFSMSLRGSQLGNGTWRGDDFGTGVSPLIGLDVALNETWSIGTELSSGLGVFRTYQNVGATTIATLSPKFFFLKAISIGFKYSILPKVATTSSDDI